MNGHDNDIRTDRALYIRELQGYLQTIQRETLGYTDVPIDGIYKQYTEDAVRQFQQEMTLPVTGIVDRTTWDAIYASYRTIVLRNAVPTAVYCFRQGAEPLKTGDNNDCVFILQIVLTAIRAKHVNLPAVDTPNGQFTDNTAAVVSAMQLRSGLPQTGEVDKATWDAIVGLYNQL